MSGNRADRRRQYRDIGVYTAIPMMMVIGPALGYWLGRQSENRWGHEPWFSAGGALFGLAAAFRQIWLILKQAGKVT